jgi:hypothetical protein
LSAKCTLFLCVKLGGRGGYRKGEKRAKQGARLGGCVVGADRAQSAQNSCEKLKNVVDSHWQFDYNKGVKERAQQDAQEVTKKYEKESI